MSTSVIKKWAVLLGFKVDKDSEAKFRSTLGSIRKEVTYVASGLTAAVTVIKAAVVAISYEFDQLYFVANRVNSTATAIKSMSYAFTQIGLAAGSARSALEGFSRAVRTNPGNEGVLRSVFGLKTRDKNGNLRDTHELYKEFLDEARKRPYYVAKLYADMFEQDETTFKSLMDNKEAFDKAEEEYRAEAKAFGVDPDKLKESSNALMTAFRALRMDADLLLDKITQELGPEIRDNLEQLHKWLLEHQDDIVAAVKWLVEAFKEFVTWVAKVVTELSPLVTKINEVSQSLTGQSGLVTALEAVAALIAGSWVVRILAAFTRVRLGWLAVLAAVGYELYFNGAAKAAEGVGKAAGMGTTELAPGETIGQVGTDSDPMQKYMSSNQGWKDLWGKSKSAIKGLFGYGDDKKAMPAPTGPSEAPAREGTEGHSLKRVTSKGGASAWVRADVAPQFQAAIDELEGTGFKVKTLGGYNYRDVRGRPGVLSAHASGQAVDINEDDNGLGQKTTTLPPEAGAIFAKYGLGWGMNWRSRKDPMHISTKPNEGGRIMTPEELEKAKSGSLTVPPPSSAKTASVEIHRSTSINVDGAKDPSSSATALERDENLRHADLVRNMQGAFV